jgi:cobalamin biosynthesis protein CobD/CbiB
MGYRDIDNACFGWVRKRKSLTNVFWGCLMIFSICVALKYAIFNAPRDFWGAFARLSQKHPNFHNHYSMNALAVIIRRLDDLGSYVLMMIIDCIGYMPSWVTALIIFVVPVSTYLVFTTFSGNSDKQSIRSQISDALKHD